MANTGVSTESFATESKTKSKGPKLRIAMIGVGGISAIHLDTLKKFPDAEVVAACDIKPERLEWAEKTYGIKKLYKDWNQMLKAVKPDAVNVCTPNGVHMPAVIDALNFGCHAITEKPMAMDPAECQKMIDAAAKAKKKLTVGFQYRFHPATQIIKRAADEGHFGNILYVKVQALRRRGIPNWGVFGQKALQGGGPMIDIGVHAIEMTHYMMGQPKPVAAAGKTWTYMGNKPSNVESMWPNWDYKTYTVEDLAVGQVRFATGALMQIEASFAAHIKEDKWNVTIVGDQGGAEWDPTALFTDRAGTMVNVTPAFVGKGDFPTMFQKKLRAWVDACLYNKPQEAPGEAGLAVQKIIDGIYRASVANKEVGIE